jgi:hypothetical protein
LVDEEAAHQCRLQRLVEALAHHGTRYSVHDVRAALAEAWAEFAPRPIVKALEKLSTATIAAARSWQMPVIRA